MSRDILVTLIDADPAQPRKHFDTTERDELAQSMAATGLIVPSLIRPVGDRFSSVQGERRYRAAQSLGWATFPAAVRDITPDEAQWFAVVETIQRCDLSPIAEAHAYRAVLDTGSTQQVRGERIGKTQRSIAFFGNATGTHHVYVIPVDGGTPTDRAPNSTADERWPVWGT